MQRYIVRAQGKGWGIYYTEDMSLVEGGFFSKVAADEACAAWNDPIRGNDDIDP